MTTTIRVAVATVLCLAAPAVGSPEPASAQGSRASGSLDAPIEVPLSTRAGRMVVPVHTADGTELSFLVTTGSAVTVLSETGAARAGEQELFLGGAPVEMGGARTLPDADLTVDGMVMDGLVSNSTLNAFDVLFDVPGGRMVLKPVGRSMEWPGVELGDPVRLRVYHGVVLALDVVVNDVEYPAMLDLGGPALLVNQRVLDETGIADAGTGTLDLGPASFQGVAVRLSDHPSITRFSPAGDGFVIVGSPPALECPVAVSWVHRELRTCVR